MDPIIQISCPESPVTIEAGMYLKDVERMLILATLRKMEFNRTRSARTLGIGIRTLQRKLKQYQEESVLAS